MSLPQTVAQALRQAETQGKNHGLARLDAQRLLLHALARDPGDRAWLLAHDTDPLPMPAAERFQALLARHASGEPMGYLIGEQAFFGLNLRVDPRVLVPRPDTETLVQWALDLLDTLPQPSTLLDLGTGSGAIALAMKSQRPAATVHASDASEPALAVARNNANRLELSVVFHTGDWLDAVPGLGFHLIVSNPPYIAEGDTHLGALHHEPISALTAGPDGLADIRRLVDGAPERLHPGGWLLLEHGHDQADLVRTLLQARGFEGVASRNDLAGIARCSGGHWPLGR
ncbi:MAG: release factor glutamine methyltransferase [Hydrogenophaga sp.]